MLYAVHNDDEHEEPGKITMATKVWDYEGYDKTLKDFGYNHFVQTNAPALIPPDHWHVIKGEIVERPLMNLQINKQVFQAGDNDAIVITGAPKNTKFDVKVQGTIVWNGTLPDGELEMSVPVPGIYHITLTSWPHKTMEIDVEAKA